MARKKTKKKTTKKATATPEVESVPPPDPEEADEYDYSDDPVDSAPAVADPPAEEETPAPDDTTEEEPPDKQVAEIDDDLLTRAVHAGMSIKEARSFGSDEALTTALVAIERAVSHAKPSTTASGETEVTPEAFKLNLDPDLYEPEVISAFEGMQKHFQGQQRDLQAKLDSVLDELKVQRQQDSERRTDGMFESLGEEWHEVFGEGPTSSLRKNSVHAKNRARVTDHMAMVHEGAKALGKTVPSDLFQDTVASVFSSHNKELADAQTRKATSARNSQALVPPTNRDGKPQSRTAMAVANLRSYMEDHGLEPMDDGYEEGEDEIFPE